MRKYVLIVMVVCALCACGKTEIDTASSIPDYTPVPTMTPEVATSSNGAQETAKPKANETTKNSGIITKGAAKYTETQIDMKEVIGVDNFTLSGNNIVCHDSNAEGTNTFSNYEKKENGKWKKSTNKVIAAFVNKYHVQVTKMRDYLVTDFDETILMGDDYVIYKMDDKGNKIASAKMTKLFGKGTFIINDWYWYKGNKVIMNVDHYDTAGNLKEKVCGIVDIDAQKIKKKYDQSWEMRFLYDGKIYADQTDQNLITNLLVINPENGKTIERIAASAIRKTAVDRTDWDKEKDDYCRNQPFQYDMCEGTLYVKYLTGIYKYDAKAGKWQQLLKESKEYTMGKVADVVFHVADDDNFYIMSKDGFYHYSKK